ncbi:MAG: thioredoxin-disulfide reductase [Actinomycetia bacterium]|nr:thioredoxin-disulfide reductase [Actinomycetes bacterium]
MKELKTDLLIIGAGPGGLGAALYARRSGLDFLIVEKKMAGGQIINTELVENYPGFMDNISGFELARKLADHCKGFKIEIMEYHPIETIDEVQHNDSGRNYKFKCSGEDSAIFARALIFAAGARPDRLGAKGEAGLMGRGISFCATCDGALYRDMEVAVVGGGDTAVEEALFLTNLAKKVYIIHRRDELRSVDMLQRRAKDNKKIEILWSSVVEEFMGDEKLEGVIIKNKKDGTVRQLEVAAVFEYVGLQPNSETIKHLVDIDEKGFIVTDMTMKTSMEGIFAIGDVRNTPFRQIITAVADGAVAAMYAGKYILDQE